MPALPAITPQSGSSKEPSRKEEVRSSHREGIRRKTQSDSGRARRPWVRRYIEGRQTRRFLAMTLRLRSFHVPDIRLHRRATVELQNVRSTIRWVPSRDPSHPHDEHPIQSSSRTLHHWRTDDPSRFNESVARVERRALHRSAGRFPCAGLIGDAHTLTLGVLTVYSVILRVTRCAPAS